MKHIVRQKTNMKSIKILGIIAVIAAFSSHAIAQGYQNVDGLQYKLFGKHQGQKPVMGDKAMCDLLFFGDNDSLVFNSIDKHQLIPIPIQKSQFKGDLLEGIQMMNVGDSAVFLVNGDSVAKLAGPQGHIKAGSKLKYIIVLRSIFDEKAEAEKQKLQAETDESIIKDYIKKNNIEGVKRTDDGLYYKVTQEGTGETPNKGQTITAHYTGKFLSGTVFDSDKDRPGPGFTFTLGYHQVIGGWDEAFGLMKKGEKATLIIPSALAYGPSGTGPIPANAVLLFDVELVDFK